MDTITRRDALALAARGSLAAVFAGFLASPAGRALAQTACREPASEVEHTILAVARTAVPGTDEDPDQTPGAAEACALDVMFDDFYGFGYVAPIVANDLDVHARLHGLDRFRDGTLAQRTAILTERQADGRLGLLYVATIALVYIAFYTSEVGGDYIGFPGPSGGYVGSHSDRVAYPGMTEDSNPP
jgi:hypothetical protein